LIYNKGSIKADDSQTDFHIDKSREYYIFDVIPMGAVRMTKRDRIFTNPNHADPKKRQREVVTRYFKFQNDVWSEYTQKPFKFPTNLEVVFCIPMPLSWSEKKRQRMNRKPCLTRPDIDNLVKAIMDALKIEDGNVWKITAEKRYSYKGSIIIFT
jgi:Holliday junction resolvase RusA-like endonuclease